MHGKVVIVTGASSGIGKALAYVLAQKQCKLVLAARSLEQLEELQAELTAKGTEVLVVKTDVADEADCQQLIEATLAKYGRIDVLINNAGISMRALFEDASLDVIRKLMDVNFWGTVYCTKYALPWVLKTKGSVVGVISIAGYIGLPGRTGYSASKFAVRGFLDTLRVENLKKDLHVLVAAPGFTSSNIRNTALQADGSMQGHSPRNESGMMSAEAVAIAITKAIEKRKRSIILTFTEGKLTVFLGKWFPKLLDKLSYNHMAKEPDSPFK
jgi:short-subunit dehydrogenase